MENKSESNEDSKSTKEETEANECYEFLKEIIDPQYLEEVFSILKQECVTTMDGLKLFSEEDLKELGLKLVFRKQIIKGLHEKVKVVALPDTKEKEPEETTDNESKNPSEDEKDVNPNGTKEIKKGSRPPKTKPHIKVEYILKTRKIINTEELMNLPDLNEYILIDNEIHKRFNSIADRDNYITQYPGITIMNKIEPFYKGVLLTVFVRDTIWPLVVEHQDEIRDLCAQYNVEKLILDENIKMHFQIYTNDSQFSILNDILRKKYIDISCFPLNFKLDKNAFFDRNVFSDLIINAANRFAHEKGVAIMYCGERNKGRKSLQLCFKVYGDNAAQSIVDKVSSLTPHYNFKDIKIFIPEESDCESYSDCSSDMVASNSEDSESNYNGKKKGGKINKLADSNKEENYIERVKKDINLELLDIQSKHDVKIVLNFYQKRHENVTQYFVNINSYGFNENKIKNSLEELGKEFYYEKIIDFKNGDENLFKGAYLYEIRHSLHKDALSNGVSLYVNFDRKSKPILSNVKLIGMRKNVEKQISKLDEILFDFQKYDIELNVKFPELKTYNDFEKQKYTEYIERYCFSILKGYKKSEFKNEVVEFRVKVLPIYKLTVNVVVCTTEKKDEEALNTGFKNVLSDLSVIVLPKQENLMLKIRERKFIFSEFMKKYNVGFVKDNMDAIIIGRKNDVELAKNSILNRETVREIFEIEELQQTYLRKRIEENLYNIELKHSVTINIEPCRNKVCILGPKINVQKALNQVKLLVKNTTESAIVEKIELNDIDYQVLKNNSQFTTEWGEKHNVSINLIDHSVLITKAQGILESNKIKIIVREGNILDDKSVEVIINSANKDLNHCSGIAFDIACAAGDKFIEESKKAAALRPNVSDVIVTSSGKLGYKFIFNAIVPIWKETNPNSPLDLKRTVKNILLTANSKKISYLAMPCLCAGCFGCPQAVSASIIFNEIMNFEENHCIKEIHLIDTNPASVEQFTALLKTPEKIKEVFAEEAKKISNWKPEYEWYWDHHELSKREKYDSDQNWNIEYAYQKFLKKEIKEVQFNGDIMQVRNSKNYVILFEEMQQMNIKTKYKRKVWRVPISKISFLTAPAKFYSSFEKGNAEEDKSNYNNDEISNDQSAAAFICVITGISSAEVKLSKDFIQNILESDKKAEELYIKESLCKKDADELLKIIRNCNCEAQFVNRGKYLQIKGNKTKKDYAKSKIWQFLIDIKKFNFSFPEYWSPQKDYLELVKLQSTTMEFIAVENRMKDTIPSVKILSIERIQNTYLWKSYCAEIQILKDIRGTLPKQCQLFHGTRYSDPSQIYSGKHASFDFRLSKEGLWGRGAYFAVNASYSHKFKYNNGRAFQMFLADVIIGDFIETEPDSKLIAPPPKPGSTNDCYDSVKGVTDGSVIFVVYNTSKAYPTYLITYIV